MAHVKTNTIPAGTISRIVSAPGMQYMLLDAGGTIFECNTGYADLLKKTPVVPGTTFNNFSVTKTATAAAILLLAEQKKILLTDSANPFFPEFHFKYPFSIQQLVAHQAGFGDPVPISWIHLPGDEKFNESAFIRQTIDKHSDQKFVPGTRFSYSSIGYLLLSVIIEKVSGEPYSSFITRNILSKINKQDAALGFEIKDPALQATGYHPRFSFSNLVLGFFLDRKKFIAGSHGSWMSFKNFYVNGKAYGGFIGNARGLASYLQLYLSNGIFSNAATKDLMFTEQKRGMAMGWFTGMLNGERYVCHAGGGGGYYCEIRIYPDRNMASVLTRNRSSFGDLRLLDKIDPYFIS